MAERKRLTKTERQAVYDKMEGRCAYCGCEISLQTMQVDHIAPLRKGGSDTMDNMWPACRSCNHYKHTLTVEQFRQEIGKAPNRLMRYDTAYRLAVRFGLLELNRKPVTFYFERRGAALTMDENTPVVTYGPWNEDEYAMFERRCPKCGRLVKADETSGAHESVGGYLAQKKEPPPNATCSHCGRVRMTFLGWTGADEEGDTDGL